MTVNPERNSRRTTSRRGLFLVVILILAATAGWVVRGNDIKEWWLSRQTIDALRGSVDSSQSDPLTTLVYSEKLIKADRIQEARESLRKAEQSLPPGASDAVAGRINARLGFLLAQNGEDTEAVTYLKRARSINDENPLVPLGFGLVFLHQKRLDYAETQFQLATNLDPSNAAGWYLFGKVSNLNSKPNQAVNPLKRAIALNPNHAPSHAELGDAYAFQALFPQAVEQFRLAVNLEPSNPENRRALGAAIAGSARNRTQYEEAAKLLEKSLNDQPNNEYLAFTLGQLHLRFNNLEPARIQLIRSTKLRPGYTEAWYNLARVEQRLGDDAASKRANAEFERLSALHDNTVIAEKRVAANSKDSHARIELARRYTAAGNIVGAYWQYMTAIKLQPDNKDVRQEYFKIARQFQKHEELRRNTHQKDDVNSMGPPPPPELMQELQKGAPPVEQSDR
jgi:tetratricopeptide (TPR) repeat protein